MKPNRFNFRVWDKEYNQMVYPDGNGYFQLENDTVITGDGDLFDLENQEIVENCILMQSTGLVDKNGKEIFENDIIKSDFLGIGIINYSENLKRFTVINPNYANEEDYCSDMTWDDFVEEFNENQYEVIGNIYENPELLEEFRKKLKELERKLEIFMKNLNF